MSATLRRRAERGVSLVEAIVAMAVMAFGMLGMIGLQSTLRGNSDTARQRAEALKLAQNFLESSRNFSVIAVPLPPASAASAFDSIASAPATDVNLDAGNTTFTVTHTVIDSESTAPTQPRTKTLQVRVSWTDREGIEQQVQLAGLLTATPPALRGSLVIPAEGSFPQLRSGRNVRLPVAAVDQNDGTSHFTPPGATGGLRWVFDNNTAVITKICNTASGCSVSNARLLSGYIRFATLAPPVAGVGINPPGSFITGVGVAVSATVPAAVAGDCYTQEFPAAVSTSYFCAVPLGATGTEWSGRSTLTGLSLAASIADATSAVFRVCRYTALRSHATVPTIKNEQHPLDYAGVQSALTNQNFLIIKAGDDVAAFECPEGLPPPAGRTWRHQPSA